MNTSQLKTQWRLFYFQYRNFFTPVGIIVVCIVLFVTVVIPQIVQFLSSQNQLASEQEKVNVLKQNFQEITGFNNQELDAAYTTLFSALPEEKNGVSILNSLSYAASETNVSLKDYSFEVGKITPLTGEAPLGISIAADGTIDSLQKFIHEIENSLPLAEVTAFDATSSTSATLNVVFYTKTAFKPNIDPNQPLHLLNKQDLNTIDELTSWQNNTITSQ